MTIFWGILIFIAGAACGVAGHYAVVALGVARSLSGEDDGIVLTFPELEKPEPSYKHNLLDDWHRANGDLPPVILAIPDPEGPEFDGRIPIPDDFWAPSGMELAARNFCEKKTPAAYKALAKALGVNP